MPVRVNEYVCCTMQSRSPIGWLLKAARAENVTVRNSAIAVIEGSDEWRVCCCLPTLTDWYRGVAAFISGKGQQPAHCSCSLLP